MLLTAVHAVRACSTHLTCTASALLATVTRKAVSAQSGLAASALQETHDLHKRHVACNSHVKGIVAQSCLATFVLQETDPGRHGFVHDHGRPFTSINSLRPAVLKVCQHSEFCSLSAMTSVQCCYCCHCCSYCCCCPAYQHKTALLVLHGWMHVFSNVQCKPF